MNFLIFAKGVFTILNFLILLLFGSYFANRVKKFPLSKSLLFLSIFLFVLCSTSYFPHLIAGRLENKYSPLDFSKTKIKPGKIYIHVLGSGYGTGNNLPATAKLAQVAQCRLIEGIRLFRQLDSSTLVFSGNSLNNESQASVAKRAAILLGVDSSRVITLDDPSTTKEEAEALSKRVDTSISLIIVTDALHMPRAINLFSNVGFNPLAAPANFKVMKSQTGGGINWWPSLDNLSLSDQLIHEYLGNLKLYITSN